jgi:arylsulfatase
MKQNWNHSTLFGLALIFGCVAFSQTANGQSAKPKIVHDSEYYILEMQHGEQWTAEDQDMDRKLAELRQKYGSPPNIIHIMWDDTAVGEVGIPAIQKVRGFETPNMNRKARRAARFVNTAVRQIMTTT